ncbi:MAG: tetratricopeptide repeat protein [Acidobacteria bacterium]|nr:tetratricopeptide repeat protein [Acidobacteriota bacterium]
MSTQLQLTLLLLLAPAFVTAQKTYPVEGAVVLEGGFTNRPITVFLEALNSRPVEEVSATVGGEFRFVDVPAGLYFIRVKHDGFEEAAQRVEVPAFNRPVTITLQRKPNAIASQSDVELGGRFQVDIRQLSIPKDAVREYQKALDENKKGRTARAMDGLRRALRIAPNFMEAAFHLGSLFYEAGRFADAEDVLMRGLKAVPAAAKLRLMLANVFVKERKYAQALHQIDAYLAENPDGPDRTSAETTRSQLIRSMDGQLGRP